ncbi:SRPBCC family protein [Streptomyces sp. NPDC051104]|uniref:SRPBCC family protein n=1 Tax=Streptomyces sp. NPDC051104 TaxID=3155044 RepID=UPI00341C92BD
MAEGTLNKVRDQVQGNPGADRLKEELEDYLQARLQVMLEGMGERLGEGARRLAETHVGPGMLTKLALKGGKKLLGGGGGGGGPGAGAGGMLSKAKDTLLGKAKEAVGGGGKNKPGGPQRGLTIIEDVDVGVPAREAYNQWTQFPDFERFAKGVEDVRQEDETTTHWQAKIAKSRRQWRGVVTEQVPDERIAWTTEGPKGTNKGVVTFHPLGDNLTKVLLVLQYYPKGLFEKTGSLWRAQGRRTRLDLKLYRSFVMTRGEATGAWRGEIRDGEVVRSSEEVEREEEEAKGRGERGEEPEERRGERGEEPEERRGEREEEPEERRGEREEEPEDREEEPEERRRDEEEEDREEGRRGRRDEDEDEEPEEEEGDEPEDDSTSEEDDEWEGEDEQPDDRYDEREAPAGRRRR